MGARGRRSRHTSLTNRAVPNAQCAGTLAICSVAGSLFIALGMTLIFIGITRAVDAQVPVLRRTDGNHCCRSYHRQIPWREKDGSSDGPPTRVFSLLCSRMLTRLLVRLRRHGLGMTFKQCPIWTPRRLGAIRRSTSHRQHIDQHDTHQLLHTHLVSLSGGLAIALLAQFAQDEMDGGIAPIGIGAVGRGGLLGCKPSSLIVDHVCVEGDESDFSLGSHG
jgi:hypothetical protein